MLNACTQMCFAVPGLVLSIDGDYAKVDFGDAMRKACVTVLPDFGVSEFVIVHIGRAIERMKPEEVKKTLALFEEMSEMASKME